MNRSGWRGPIERISAVTLHTSDMRRAVTFYQHLGFELVSGGPEEAFSTFGAGDGLLNLQLHTESRPSDVEPRPPWGRIVFWVDDVDAEHRRAEAAGLATEAAPADASWGERYFHIRDPDGHELSFARPLAPGR